jgi:hypothetical protein
MFHHSGVGCQHSPPICAPSSNLGTCTYRVDCASLVVSLAADVYLATTQRAKQDSSVHLQSAPSLLETFEAVACSTTLQRWDSINKLRRSYPLRLRQEGYVTPFAPTLIQRADFRTFKTLNVRILRLQRCAAMLRNSHRTALMPPNTGQNRERNKKNLRLRPVTKPPHPLQRNEGIALCQPPTNQIRSQSRRSLLDSALPPTKSCRTSTWRVIQPLSEWLFKLPLEFANLLAPKSIRVRSSGTHTQASQPLPASPTFMAPSLLQERSLN